MARITPNRITLFTDLIHSLINLVFPPSCVVCQQAGQLLCDRCAQAVAIIDRRVCQRCGSVLVTPEPLCHRCSADPTPVLRFVRSASFHSAPLSQMIHALKYDNKPALARPLARYLCAAFAQPVWQPIASRIDVVIPVPMFEQKRLERGYNQAELLSYWFCQATKLPSAPQLMRRIRYVRQQAGLKADERQANVAEAFAASPRLAGRNILLIDDVYTTGATLRACAHAALQVGANAVFGLALAVPIVNEHPDSDRLTGTSP